MELLLRPMATPLVRSMTLPWLFHPSKTKSNHRVFNAKREKEEDEEDDDDDEQHFKAAMKRASLRHQENLRPDPLFTDPYIRCLLPSDTQTDVTWFSHKHCITTKFIDNKLISEIKKNDGLRQVVLLTDGMDTDHTGLIGQHRLYCLMYLQTEYSECLCRSLKMLVLKFQEAVCSFMFHPKPLIFNKLYAAKGLMVLGPACGFSSIMQGLQITSLSKFKDILGVVSNLAMKGCLFFGELPGWLVETEVGVKSTAMEYMNKLFTSHGLRVEVIEYDEVARDDDHTDILFVAEQLQFSDDQMEIWRTEFQRLEEEGDEEGFED